jgi:hypothetical protein
MHELGEKAHLNPETFGILNIRLQQQSVFQRIHLSNIVLGAVDVIFLNQNQQEISPKIPLDPISSKNNVIFKTAVKWMPKKNISNAAIHKA